MQAATPMTRDVIVAAPELSLDAAWRIMQRRRIRHLPVVSQGVLVGILSDRDILLLSSAGPKGEVQVPPMKVGEAMTPAPVVCDPEFPVGELARIMTERKIDALPVVSSTGALVGLVTSTDLMLLLIDWDEAKPLPFVYRVHGSDSPEAMA